MEVGDQEVEGDVVECRSSSECDDGTARAAKPATAVNSTGKGGSRSGKAALVSALRFLTALMKEMTNLVLPWWRWARLKVAV